VEPGVGRVPPGEGERRASERAREHAGADARAEPVQAEDEADAAAVTPAERGQLVRVGVAQRVLHDERRVVLDARSREEGADEQLHVLGRRPRRPCAESEALVEGADLVEHPAADEHRGRVPGVPHVLDADRAGGMPAGRGAAVPLGGPARQDVDGGALAQESAGALEEVVGIGAVVVGEGDDVARHVPEPRVPRP
jgi:hypothetical protein